MSITGLFSIQVNISNIQTKWFPNISIGYSEYSLQNHFTQHTSPSQHGHPTPQKIHLNPKIWPFFEHALGTHILCSPLLYNWPPHWNKKVSFPRTVFLPVISTSFCHTRWERSVTDAQMLEAGLHAGFDISNGYYYLADVGYPPTSKMSWLPIVVVPSCQMELSWTKVSDLPLNLEPVWMQTIRSSDII